MPTPAIAIYTGKPVDTILNEGGSQAWVLDKKNARKAAYAVLCFNPNAEWSEGTVDHGAAFIVGKISSVVPAKDEPERSIVLFDEFCEVDIKNVWGGWRNPIKYTTMEELGIDVDSLEFQPMPEIDVESFKETPSNYDTPLTIEAAKSGLAATFGVEPDAIEITIRG